MDSLCVIDTRARADRTRVRSCTRAADLCDRSAGGQRRFGVVNCARCHDFICARLTFKLFYYFLPNFIEKVEKNVATDTTQLLLESKQSAGANIFKWPPASRLQAAAGYNYLLPFIARQQFIQAGPARVFDLN